MLDSNDYSISVERTETQGYKIDTSLNKELNFAIPFDNFSDMYEWKFGDSEEIIKYFGINNASSEEMNKNVEILFFNRENENSARSDNFAIKLKTKEGDEIILIEQMKIKILMNIIKIFKIKQVHIQKAKNFLKEMN